MRAGAHLTFNFTLINDLNKNSTAQDFVEKIQNVIERIPFNSKPTWVVGITLFYLFKLHIYDKSNFTSSEIMTIPE